MSRSRKISLVGGIFFLLTFVHVAILPLYDEILTNTDFILGAGGQHFHKTYSAQRPNDHSDFGLQILQVLAVALAWVLHANTRIARVGQFIDFTDDERNEIVAKLSRPGFAVMIGPDGVSEPFMPDEELLRRIYAAFTPVFLAEDESEDDDTEDSPEDLSDQDEHRSVDDIDDAEERGQQENDDTEDLPEGISTPPFSPPR